MNPVSTLSMQRKALRLSFYFVPRISENNERSASAVQKRAFSARYEFLCGPGSSPMHYKVFQDSLRVYNPPVTRGKFLQEDDPSPEYDLI